jgi:uncharacterized DUF497 family protein
MIFEWDAAKARKNLSKQHVSFGEASSVFGDPLSLTIHDPLHSGREDRFVTLGRSVESTLLVVMPADRGDRIRMISARLATRRERRTYEEGS